METVLHLLENADFFEIALDEASANIEYIMTDLMDDSTAFERLLFLAVPVYNRIKQSRIGYDQDYPAVIIWLDEENKPVGGADVKSDEDLIEKIFSMLYNFCAYIDKRYVGNVQTVYKILFHCGRLGGKACLLELDMKNFLKSIDQPIENPDIEGIVWYNKGDNALMRYDSEDQNNKNVFSNVWRSIADEIKNDLYVSDSSFEEMQQYFDCISKASEDLYEDIYEPISGLYNKDKKKIYVSEEYLNEYSFICNFPSKETIIKYNNSFYELATACFKNHAVFSQSDVGRRIIDRISNIGLVRPDIKKEFNRKSKAENFWLLSPFAMNSIRNIYERLPKFATGELKESHNGCIRNVLEGTFCHYVLSDFKRWIYNNDNNYVVTFEGDNSLLSCYPAHSISSVSLIRAIRLYEKVKDFINSKKEKNDIKVCLVGYTRTIKKNSNHIAAVEIDALAKFVEMNFSDINVNVHYTVIMNKKKPTNHQCIQSTETKRYTIDVKYQSYDELFLKENISKLIDDNNLIFFIDCPDLYYDEFDQRIEGSWYSMYNAMRFNSYNDNYDNARIGEKLNAQGVLSNIDSQLSVLSNRNAKGYGSYRPVIKEYILDYMSSKILSLKDSDDVKTIYCFMSTLESKVSDKYLTYRFTHAEDYNNKRFYIVKISSGDCEKIKDSEYIKEPMDFSMWNIVKNVDISLKNSYFKTQKPCDTENVLDSIAVRLSWDTRMENYTIKWGICRDKLKKYNICTDDPEEIFENINYNGIGKFLQDLFYIVFGKDKNFVGNAVKNSVCNILLGRTSTVYHILLYYRIKSEDLNVNEIKFERLTDDNEIAEIINNNNISNASDKRLYYDMIKALSAEYIDDVERAGLIRHIKTNGGDSGVIFSNIKNACEKCEYTDSNLYKNMMKG